MGLVAIEPATQPRRAIGMDRGRIVIRDDFDDPLPEFDLDAGDVEDLVRQPAP